MSQQFTLPILSLVEIESAYRGDWMARKIIDIPAFDSTREWRGWQAARDQITDLAMTEKRHGIQRKLLSAITKARLYGGSCIILGVNGTGEFYEPLDYDAIKKDSLDFAHVVERWQMYAGPLVRDIRDIRYGKPAYYMRSNVPVPADMLSDLNKRGTENPKLVTQSLKYDPGGMLTIHPSRVVQLLGNEYPDMEHAPDSWSDSVLQTVHDALRAAGMVGSSIATMVSEAKLDVITVPGLSETLATDAGTSRLVNRFANANVAKSVINALLLDKNETWDRKEIHPAGLEEILMSYMQIACAAADIPATRFLSMSPKGLNATGESDTRNYYDRLRADQTMKLTPAIEALDEVIIRTTFGKRDPELTYTWNSLWQEDTKTHSDNMLKKAQAFQIDVNSAILDPLVLKKGRENQLIADGVYPGMDQALEESEFDPDNDEIDERLLGKKPDPNEGEPGASGASGASRAIDQ